VVAVKMAIIIKLNCVPSKHKTKTNTGRAVCRNALRITNKT
jgi:hypothetical protein